ncbi:hypothetical protein AB4Z51_27810 [Bradyrhizobium sp. 2TAF36]|uniref:hypothetical protein n=1 Tax=Bradyrhizobium sp. 2TAF36 TaxID=3233016 RepID=UPI003F90956A
MIKNELRSFCIHEWEHPTGRAPHFGRPGKRSLRAMANVRDRFDDLVSMGALMRAMRSFAKVHSV